jgi:hypothetical protein
VQSGDTLQSIAAGAYGDSALWFRIAQANGLSGNGDLKVGQTLAIPSGVQGTHNNAGTFQPYDPSKVVGDTSPNLPAPPKDEGCGVVGQIIILVVVVIVAYFTQQWYLANYAAPATAYTGAALEGSTLTLTTATEYSAADMAVAAAAGGAAGSVAGQAVAMAAGMQNRFDWGQVGLAAIGGAVGGALTGSAPLGGNAASLGNTVVRSAIGNAITQGIGVATGLQEKFNWRGVAAAAAGSGVGHLLNEGLGLTDKDGKPAEGMGASERLAKATLSGLSAGIVAAMARGGRVSVERVAADAFGNALGDSLAHGDFNGGSQQLQALQGLGTNGSPYVGYNSDHIVIGGQAQFAFPDLASLGDGGFGDGVASMNDVGPGTLVAARGGANYGVKLTPPKDGTWMEKLGDLAKEAYGVAKEAPNVVRWGLDQLVRSGTRSNEILPSPVPLPQPVSPSLNALAGEAFTAGVDYINGKGVCITPSESAPAEIRPERNQLAEQQAGQMQWQVGAQLPDAAMMLAAPELLPARLTAALSNTLRFTQKAFLGEDWVLISDLGAQMQANLRADLPMSTSLAPEFRLAELPSKPALGYDFPRLETGDGPFSVPQQLPPLESGPFAPRTTYDTVRRVVPESQRGVSDIISNVENASVPARNAFARDPNQPLLLTYSSPTTHTVDEILRMQLPDRWQAGEQFIQELYGSTGQQHFPVPAGVFNGEEIRGAGGRFVDAPVPTSNGGVLANEVKTYRPWTTVDGQPTPNSVGLTDTVQQQVLKDSWLKANVPGYNPRWNFIGAPPSVELDQYLTRKGIDYLIYH